MCKAFFTKVGRNFHCGTRLPFVIGTGRIYVGDNVRFHGKQDFSFAAIGADVPEIHIGDNCTIGNAVTMSVAGKLVIGNHCLIAGSVVIEDCNGHSIDPAERIAKVPPSENDMRPVTIGNNVWIGNGAYIMPGTTIGDGCVISAMTAVSKNIPPNHLVYSTPPKAVVIRSLAGMKKAAHTDG